ncbi:MAG: hypothetical protein VX519_10450 [Myxococcota bacterium]|nr:hypothetical protein [Myxococcota bacterium]
MTKASPNESVSEMDPQEVSEPGQESISAIDQFREELYGAMLNSGHAVTTANGLGDFDVLLKELLAEVLNKKADEKAEIDFL